MRNRFEYMLGLVVIILSIASQSYGQDNKLFQSKSMADRYFETEQYYKASQLYKQMFEADSTDLTAAYQLAASYQGIFQYKKAMYYYKLVQEADAEFQFPLAVYYHALMLKYNEKFKEAIVQFDKFLSYPEHIKNFKLDKLQTYEKQAKIEKEGCYFALTQLSRRSKTYDFYRVSLPVNSEFNDYAPAIYSNDSSIVITSSRITSRSVIDNRFGESFDDNFRFEKNDDEWKKVNNDDEFEIVNSRWPDGSGCFNVTKDKYYYTSCDDKNGWCSIYLTQLEEGKWQSPVRLNKNINYPKSHTKQPAINPTGDTLFFVSDREGGLGKNDLWMSVSAKGENWGPAVNLGEEINTPFNESSPFYYPEQHILFFSSEGLEGFGALDIYMVKANLQNKRPQNLGWPFNTSRDDGFFTFGEQRGYLASNRNDTDTKFDIYTFQKDPSQSLTSYFEEGKGKSHEFMVVNNVENAKYNGLINANVSDIPTPITDFSLSYPFREETLRTGAVRFVLSSNIENGRNTLQESNFQEEKEIIIPSAEVDLVTRKELLQSLQKDDVQIPHTPGALATISTFNIDTTRKAIINSKLMRFDTTEPVMMQTVQLADANGEILKVTTTDENGIFKFANIEAKKQYKILLNDQKEDDLYEKYYLKDLEVVNYSKEVTSLKFENIYFDVGHFSLRNEAKVVLDDLIDLHKQNPNIQIEINAYTDGEGGDEYNLILSRNRGLTAFQYLIENGIDRTTLVINAKGKEAPVASNDNPVGKQLNRRVEFEIIGPDLTYNEKVVTQILKQTTSVRSLAENTGMSVEELEALNHFKDDHLKAYTPVRVWSNINLTNNKMFAEIDNSDTVPAMKQTN